MRTVLVTGHRGFLGRNLRVALDRRDDVRVIGLGSDHTTGDLTDAVAGADFIYHLGGVNRPPRDADFTAHNVDLTVRLCHAVETAGRPIPLVFSSSVQADLDNPYGRSKRAAEDAVLELERRTGTPVYVDRLPNVFGKWSKPNYNTVVATFCHNTSRGLPTRVDDPAQPLRLAYVDDVVRRWIDLLDDTGASRTGRRDHQPIYEITLGELLDRIGSFNESRRGGLLPNLADPLTKALYATYLSFLDTGDLASPVALKTDPRGWLFELVKSSSAGQIFVSRTRPGVTRGNHFHDSKAEKFCVVQGRGVIRFRDLSGDSVVEYRVDDRDIRIVDIPPGLTHSIENDGTTDMITIFWASEIFDPRCPDTHAAAVLSES